jgi:two-component system NtrC family sensor kinase
VTVHQILPLAAFVLNLCLIGICLVRNPGSRVNRVFAYFVAAMALWNFGVFMLRGAREAAAASFWETIIHVGVCLAPAVYYHFVLIFLDETHRHRQRLAVGYAVALFFSAANLGVIPGFIGGVRLTAWGWAPAAGPLYQIFFVYFHLVFVAGLVHLVRAYRRADTAFRRNRALLVLVGTSVIVAGAFVDILRFTLAGIVPAAERLYPMGIPANMLSAAMFAIAIVRYRMFDVSLVVKKSVIYGGVGAGVTAFFLGAAWGLERAFALGDLTSIGVAIPLGFAVGLLLTPLGRPVEDWIESAIFHRPQGCHDTLLDLSKGMATLLELDRVVETLVHGLVRGIPLTHSALFVLDEAAEAYVLRREETASGASAGVRSLPARGALTAWLASTPGILVKEEALLDRRMAAFFGQAPGTLESLNASLIVPLRIETNVKAILLLGEKLSGETFTAEELEVLGVLANQAAISMENARLFEQAERERRRIAALYEVSRRLASVHEPDEMLALIVNETARVLGAEMAAVRLVEGRELVLRAWTASVDGERIRPRLSLGQSLTGAVVDHNEPVIVEDAATDERCDPGHRQFAADQGLHSFVGVPLRADGRAIGVLFALTSRRRCFDADTVSLLTALADQASVSVERSRLAEERRKTEDALRQSEKLATMGQLLAGVAHELNNPLTVIVGFAGLLSTKLAGGPLQESARQITGAAERCGRIVRNFLALARKHPPERKQVVLNQVVSDAVELLTYPLNVDGVKLTMDLAGDLPLLWADPHQLQQVVVNLLTNAHHALRQAPVRQLSVSTRFDSHRQRVVLRIADSGPGIPPDIQSRIFEPFFTTKPVGQGTGLGLSLCHGIIEGHGGSIGVDSRPGEGAVFTVDLPLEQAEAPPAEGESPTGADVVNGKRVLVVDDEPGVARLLAEFLSTDGHRVETAESAAAALGKLRDGSYDVIVSDIRMPDLDGRRFYQDVAAREPGQRPPFVFVTGDVLGTDTRQFLEQTRAPHIAKPFTVDDVRRALRLALVEQHWDATPASGSNGRAPVVVLDGHRNGSRATPAPAGS